MPKGSLQVFEAVLDVDPNGYPTHTGDHDCEAFDDGFEPIWTSKRVLATSA